MEKQTKLNPCCLSSQLSIIAVIRDWAEKQEINEPDTDFGRGAVAGYSKCLSDLLAYLKEAEEQTKI